MKLLLIFLSLCLVYLGRASFLAHEDIHGLSEAMSILTNTSIFIGVYIAFLATTICWQGRVKVRYLFLSFLAAVCVKDLLVFKYIVYGYEFVFKGHLPLKPSDDYISTMHNSYITMMWVCLSIALVFIRFNPNPIRKIASAPLLIIFLGFNFYHFYQYILINAPTWEASRENAVDFIDPVIDTDGFSIFCEKVDGMECFEFSMGETLPEGMVYPASTVLNEFKDKYDTGKIADFVSNYTTEHGTYLKLHFYDGQVDHSFAPAFWASINMYIDFKSGLIRVAEYDHIGMVHQGCVAAVIALCFASMLWMSCALLLCSFHPSGLKEKDSRGLRVLATALGFSFFVLDYAPLHYSYLIMFISVTGLFFFRNFPSWKVTKEIGSVIFPHLLAIALIFSGLNSQALSVVATFALIGLLSYWVSIIESQGVNAIPVIKMALILAFMPSIVSLSSSQFLGAHSSQVVGEFIAVFSFLMAAAVAWKVLNLHKSKNLTGESAILLLSAMVLWTLNMIYCGFINPITFNYLGVQAAKEFNVGKLDLDSLHLNIVTFYAFAVFTVGVFLRLIFKHLRYSHSKFKR